MHDDLSPAPSAAAGISSPFTLTVERGAEALVVSAAGELDVSTASELAAVVQGDRGGSPRIVIDLSGLTFMDCAGLRVLLDVHERADADGCRLTLIPGPEVVQRVFRITGAENRLRFSEHRDGEPPAAVDGEAGDHEIRVLLARQPRPQSLPHPPGTVAILRQDIERSGADMGQVDRWIGAHGGVKRLASSIKTSDQTTLGGIARWEGPFHYFVIPLAALGADSGAHEPTQATGSNGDHRQ